MEICPRPVDYARLLDCRGKPPTCSCGGGAGPPVWTMTQNYCREMVVNKGITDATRFEQEVKKCMADPITYPPAYSKPSW